MKIGIVSDSAAGFTSEEMKKYSEIKIVPLTIIDENDKVYEDNYQDITDKTLYMEIIENHKHLKTSQTNRAKLEQYWDAALAIYDEILFLPIAKAASGQYNNAMVLQKEEKYKNKVYILETGAASIPLKFMTLIAFKLAKEGKNIKEIINSLQLFRTNYESYISPNDLKYLARGGRLPKSKAIIGNLLRFKPIIKCKEKIENIHKARTLNSAMDKMLELIMTIKDVTKETIYIINGWCDKKYLDKAIQKVKSLGFTKYKIEELDIIQKIHTGNNTIGFSVVPNPWVKEL